ncbi:MAG: winged helix-turn-helix domain-containing protein [Chloroflexia bacterium]|nr:winged helix-turn-helix domain-containing protein [Chloroflexia bacterium]
MELVGLREPILQQTGSGFKVTLLNSLHQPEDEVLKIVPDGFISVIDELHRNERISIARAVQLSGMSAPTVRRYLQRLADAGVVERIATSSTDARAFWQLRERI